MPPGDWMATCAGRVNGLRRLCALRKPIHFPRRRPIL